jgi:putative component of toxin-antitoxin plasmid stabilization module
VVTLRYEQPIATRTQPAGHAVSFMAMGGQVSFPPGYKPYYDHADHVVMLRYTGPLVTETPAAHAVSFMAMGGQAAFPPGYRPYYDHADHVVILRYAHGASTASTHG